MDGLLHQRLLDDKKIPNPPYCRRASKRAGTRLVPVLAEIFERTVDKADMFAMRPKERFRLCSINLG